MALICKAEIPYTPHKFLFIIFFIRFNFIFLSIDHILLIESELIISNIILIFPGDDSKRICVGFVRLKKMLQHWLMTTATATEFQIPWGLDKSKARPQTVTEIIYYDDTCNFVVQSSQGQAGVNILPVPPVPGQRKWSLKLTQNGTIIIIILLLLLPHDHQ